MPLEQWNNGENPGESQASQQNLNPSFAERQNLNNQMNSYCLLYTSNNSTVLPKRPRACSDSH